MMKIEVGLECAEGTFPLWARKLLELPKELRPTHHSISERGRRKEIGDHEEFLASFSGKDLMPFMFRKGCGYFVSTATGRTDKFSADLSAPLSLVEYFLTEMAALQPIFGYACLWEEYIARNRIYKRTESGLTEAWVGRDPTKQVPGLYWLTLLPEKLARQHGVPLKEIAAIALNHVTLPGGQHLFRFYDRPEDWKTDTRLKAAIGAIHGIFDIERVLAEIEPIEKSVDLDAILRRWR